MELIVRHWADLMVVFAAFVLAVGSPGPSTLSIMGTSMSEGRTMGLALALGVTAGSVTWGLLAAVGISALLAGYAPAITVIKIAGGLYLLYLAWRAGQAALGNIEPAHATSQVADRSMAWTVGRGYLMHLTNPKAILGWTAIMSLGLKPDTPMVVVMAMLAGCFVISVSVNCGYAALFSTSSMINGYCRARRSVQSTLAVLFAAAGLKLLLSR